MVGVTEARAKAVFDISEWMLSRLIDALHGRVATVALLCKTAVARRVIELAYQRGRPLGPVGLWRIDSSYHFGASVDAWLFVFRTGAPTDPAQTWPVFADLGATKPEAQPQPGRDRRSASRRPGGRTRVGCASRG